MVIIINILGHGLALLDCVSISTLNFSCTNESYCLSIILFDTQKKRNKINEKLVNYENNTKLAKKNNDDDE
jgi:hypothetical protein